MYPSPRLGLTVMPAGPRPGTVMDSAATLGWRNILPGETTAPRPVAPTITYQRPVLTQANLPAQPLAPLPPAPIPAVTSRPPVPFVPGVPTANGGMPQAPVPVFITPGVRPLPVDVAPFAPTMPVVPGSAPSTGSAPSPAVAASILAAQAQPQPTLTLAPVVSTSGGQVIPASGGGGVAADGGGTPLTAPAVTGDSPAQASVLGNVSPMALGIGLLVLYLVTRGRR